MLVFDASAYKSNTPVIYGTLPGRVAFNVVALMNVVGTRPPEMRSTVPRVNPSPVTTSVPLYPTGTELGATENSVGATCAETGVPRLVKMDKIQQA